MSKSKFLKPPSLDKDKEVRVEAFINDPDDERASKRLTKENVKPVYLRAPFSLWEDIHEVMAITGLSMNAICLELLRPGIKSKLKELNDL